MENDIKHDLIINELYYDKDSKDILDKLAVAIYQVLRSEELFYLAMQGANERGVQFELFKQLNSCSEFKNHVELEFPIGNKEIDMVIFNPDKDYKKELLYLIEFKHYSVIQNLAETHLSNRKNYLIERLSLTSENPNIEAICIELVLEYNFYLGNPPQNPLVLKKYRFPLRYDPRFKENQGLRKNTNSKNEMDIQSNFIKAKKEFFEVFKDNCRYCKKSVNVENDVEVTLHLFVCKVTKGSVN